MNRQLYLILVLFTALVVVGSALAGDVGCCDSVCCDVPCAPAAGERDTCACCALAGSVSDDPSLPAVPAAKVAPDAAVMPAPAGLASGAPVPAVVVPIGLPDPPPARPVVLRI